MVDLNEEVKKYLSELGKKGGASKSERKKESSRLNGKKGGRPKVLKDPPS